VLPPDVEEERRLFYVAMTRAKDDLYILSAKERYNKVMEHSRFIDEIKAEDKDKKIEEKISKKIEVKIKGKKKNRN
jgi:DNA helicase-2/ATP-dependent DNA helicase PcrA